MVRHLQNTETKTKTTILTNQEIILQVFKVVEGISEKKQVFIGIHHFVKTIGC